MQALSCNLVGASERIQHQALMPMSSLGCDFHDCQLSAHRWDCALGSGLHYWQVSVYLLTRSTIVQHAHGSLICF